jgi:predicted MFS family arabinose efflux permease
VNGRRLHFAVIALNIIAIATIDIVPTIEVGTRISLGFGPEQTSIFSSLLMGGSVAGSLLALLWVRRARWPSAALLSLCGIVLLNALSAAVRSPAQFFALQCALGVCTASLYSLTLTIMSDQPEPEKYFGLLIAGQVGFQGVGLYFGPLLLSHGGLTTVMLALAALSLAGLPLVKALPDHGRSVPEGMTLGDVLRPATLLAFCGCFAFYLSTWSYWTYIEAIGHEAGYGDQQIATSLAIGVAGGFAGASAASSVGRHWSQLWLLGTAAAMLVLSVWLIAGRSSLMSFIISGCLFNFSWNFSVAYQYAIVNAADPTARAVALTPAVHTAGGMVGPVIGILVLRPHDFTGVLWLVGLGVLASQALFTFAERAAHRSAAAR